MARGDITFFEEATADVLVGWASADVIKCAILDNTATPAASDATPSLADYTEVGTDGNYVAGGSSIGTWGAGIEEAAGVMTFDSDTNPEWAANASNDEDAYWALLYNDTQAGDPAFAFVDLGGPFDMTAGLTVTWNASGIFSVTINA